MNEQQHIQKCEEIIARWFEHHQASMHQIDPLTTIIKWQHPGQYEYSMTCFLSHGSFIVIGDIGHAIYTFGIKTGVEDLRKYSLDYFVSKCTASETGANYVQKVPGIKDPVVNIRAIAHWRGMHMALTQLKIGAFQ